MDFLTRKLAGYVLCADNTTLDSGSGGDTIRTEDRTTFKTPVSLLDVGGTSAEALIGDSGVAMPVRGLAAEDAAASGNPVPAGGRYDATPRTLDDGDRGEVALNASAQALVEVATSALPSGAATAAKQPALGTAGTPSADVITVQGVTSMTALKVDGSDVTQPVSLASAVPVTDNSGSLTVDNAALSVTGGGVEASALRVTLASDSTGVISVDDNGGALTVDGTVTANAGTNLNTSALALETGGNLAAAATSLATLDNIVAGNEAQVDVVTVPAPLSTTGGGTEATALRVTVASDSTGVLSVDDNGGALTVDNAGTFAVQSTLTPATSGGLDTFKSTDIDETEEDVKTSAGLLYWIYCVNTNASARYLKVYNATAASVTVGSTATKLDLLIPPSNSGFFIQFPHGITFSTAISVAATTGVGDADSGAPGASEVQVTVGYK